MRIIRPVIQAAGSESTDKLLVILERAADSAPDHVCFAVCFPNSRDEDVEAVRNSAAFVVDNVIFAGCRGPDESFPRKRRVGRYDIGWLPFFTGLGQPAVFIGAQGKDGTRQVSDLVELTET